MPKNIIVCCDGTGNEVEANLSNVLKLYRIVRRNEDQVVFYHPGVGTISDSEAWSRFKFSNSPVTPAWERPPDTSRPMPRRSGRSSP